jgi:hypothetical protein
MLQSESESELTGAISSIPHAEQGLIEEWTSHLCTFGRIKNVQDGDGVSGAVRVRGVFFANIGSESFRKRSATSSRNPNQRYFKNISSHILLNDS